MENSINKKLPEAVAEEIIQFIIEQGYKEKDKLPTESEFMSRLGVGRGTIREAIRILCARNVIEVIQGAGSFVSQHKGVPADPFGFMFLRNKQKTIHDLMEVRCLIEPHIAMLAAQYAQPHELLEMQEACKRVEECINHGESHGVADMEFHTCIARCSRNDVISQLVPIINTSISLFINMTQNKLTNETIDAHRAILWAIENKDCIGARDEMFMHLSIVKKGILFMP